MAMDASVFFRLVSLIVGSTSQIIIIQSPPNLTQGHWFWRGADCHVIQRRSSGGEYEPSSLLVPLPPLGPVG